MTFNKCFGAERVGVREMDGMEGWFGYDHIEKGDAVSLYDEEEKLLQGNVKQRRSEHRIGWIGPYASAY